MQNWWAVAAGVSAVGMAVALSRGSRSAPTGGGSNRSRSALIINGEALCVEDGSGGPGLDGVEAVFRSIEDLAFTIETGRVCLYETVDGRDLADFGLVQVAAYPRPTGTLLNAVAEYLRGTGVLAVNVEGVGAPTRLLQSVRFALAGLPVPATRYLPPRLLGESYPDLADQLGLPFVLKALSASGGRFNFLIGNERDFADRLRDHDHRRVMFMAQEFIPNDRTFRLLVLGGEAPVVTRLTRVGAAYLTNTALGGDAALVGPAEFDPAARQLAVRAAALMGSDVAAVNVIQHWTTGRWYVLDVNATPAIASGAFVKDKLEAYSSYLRRSLGPAMAEGARLRS